MRRVASSRLDDEALSARATAAAKASSRAAVGRDRLDEMDENHLQIDRCMYSLVDGLIDRYDV